MAILHDITTVIFGFTCIVILTTVVGWVFGG